MTENSYEQTSFNEQLQQQRVVDIDALPQALEALLFVSDEPVSTSELADITLRTTEEIHDALEALKTRLSNQSSGIILREVASGWRLFTHPDVHDVVERYVLSWDTRRLSQAALETLSIVAYNQPVTRAQVAAIRGVSSDSSINSLMEKGLVRTAGKEDGPGQAQLYATTTKFLEHFGLKSVQDLPPLEDYAPDEEAKERIRERLGLTEHDKEEAVRLFADDEELAIDLAHDVVDIRQGYMDNFYDEATQTFKAPAASDEIAATTEMTPATETDNPSLPILDD
ncbi:MAG: SMC-Scp complex subunit ScpB [Eggerthellaceae bacterium]|nr:SMC-Scp complex subunit ScpB [Eggerthellaceae bacterium]